MIIGTFESFARTLRHHSRPVRRLTREEVIERTRRGAAAHFLFFCDGAARRVSADLACSGHDPQYRGEASLPITHLAAGESFITAAVETERDRLFYTLWTAPEPLPEPNRPACGIASLMLNRNFKPVGQPGDAAWLITVEVADWRAGAFGSERVSVYEWLPEKLYPYYSRHLVPGPPLDSSEALAAALRLNRDDGLLRDAIQQTRWQAARAYGAGAAAEPPALGMKDAAARAEALYYDLTDRHATAGGGRFNGHWTFEFGSANGGPYKRIRVGMDGRAMEL